MLRFLGQFQADFQLKSGWIEPLLVGGYAPFSPLSAGMWFLSMNVGSKILSMLMESTGFGYAVGAALDAATSAAFAWAIGSTAKAYFRNEYLGKSKLTKEELGEIFRKAFRDQKNK